MSRALMTHHIYRWIQDKSYFCEYIRVRPRFERSLSYAHCDQSYPGFVLIPFPPMPRYASCPPATAQNPVLPRGNLRVDRRSGRYGVHLQQSGRLLSRCGAMLELTRQLFTFPDNA